MSNAFPCCRITAAGARVVVVVASMVAWSVGVNVNVVRTSTQNAGPTQEGGKYNQPPRRELSHAHLMRGGKSGPTNPCCLHLSLNQVA